MRILCHIKSVIDVYSTQRIKHHTAHPAGDFGDRQVFCESGKGVNPFTSDKPCCGHYAFVHDARPHRYKIEGEQQKNDNRKIRNAKIYNARATFEYIIVVYIRIQSDPTCTRAPIYTFGTII